MLLVGAAVLSRWSSSAIVAEPIHVFARGLWVTLKDCLLGLMINFRFHLVSLIAIFLALALGVVIGAGVIDRGMVDTLNSRLDTVEARPSASRARTTCCRRGRQLADAIGDDAVPARSSSRSLADDVGIVAVRGVDGDRARTPSSPRPAGGGTVTGTLWLEDKWALANDDDVAAMAQAVGLVVEEQGDACAPQRGSSSSNGSSAAAVG